MIRYFDLFAGVGGFRAGLDKARGFECIGHCEIDKFAHASYRAIHDIKESEVYYEDAKTINTNTMPEFDLLCAGFPCQAFSMAGKREGMADPRGSVFYEIARLARDKKPAYLLLENVPGILHHDRGRTFVTILATLCELGYGVEWQILNSQAFGVPQARRRVYFIGYLDPRCTGQILPFRTDDAAFALCAGRRDGMSRPAGVRIRSGSGYKWAFPGDCIDFAYAANKHRTARIKRQLAYTLSTQPDKGVVTLDGRIRRLTPRECFRLQGFGETQIDKVLAISSDSQAYKQAGNAVTVNIVEALGRRLVEVDETLKKRGSFPLKAIGADEKAR